MKSASLMANPEIRGPIAALLTWLLPGAGHLFIGERNRGLIFMIVIGLTFWTGVAIGGVKNTVNPDQRKAWFIGQICTGGHALAAMAWSKQIEVPAENNGSPSMIAYGRAEEVSVVYTGICGMLNVLVILDVLVRAEKTAETSGPRSKPKVRGASA